MNNDKEKMVTLDEQFIKKAQAAERTTNLLLKFHPFIQEFKEDEEIYEMLRKVMMDIIAVARIRSADRRDDLHRVMLDNGINPDDIK